MRCDRVAGLELKACCLSWWEIKGWVESLQGQGLSSRRDTCSNQSKIVLDMHVDSGGRLFVCCSS